MIISCSESLENDLGEIESTLVAVDSIDLATPVDR